MNARAAYVEESNRVETLLVALSRKVAEEDEKDPNWGHVGSMQHVANLLQEVYEFIEDKE